MGTSGASSSGSGAAALPGSSRGTQVALGCVVALELVVSTGLVLLPLRDRLSDLGHLKGWTSQYSVSLSDLDVWVLSIVKCGALLLLLALAPSLASAGRNTSDPPVHKQLRQAASLVCTIVQLLLLSKAVVVAVSAPDDVWPTAAEPDQPLFVGLANMFSCIGVCLLASFVEGPLVRSLLRDMQDTYEAAAERASTSAANGLTEPLLPSSKKVPDEEEGAGKPTPAESAAKARADKSVAVRRAIGQLVSLSLPDTPINVAAFLAGSVAALATALVPYYTGLVIDYASIEPDRAKFFATIVRLVWVSALCGVFTGIRGGLFTLSMTRLNVRIRRRLFHALVQMEMGFFDKNKMGDITSRLSSDTNSASDQITLCMNVTMRSITQAVLVLVFMLYASWRLTTVTFIMIPFIMAISSVYGKYYSALTKRVRTELADANAEAEEVLGSMATIKAHAAQESSEVAYGRNLDSYFALSTRAAAAYAGYACLYTFLPSAVSAVVLFYGGNLVLQGKMSPGSLVSFMLYQQSLSGAFQSMADVFSGLMAAVGAADKVLELMNRTPEVSTSGSLIPTTFSGRIEFRDVIFRYPARPEQPVLRGLSLLVNPGEVVALVGPSGGGKSSIVKLVERFYLPHSGAVLVDGRDLGVYNNKWLRRQVALVSQEPVLYARSIRRNIIYGLEPEDGEPSPPSMEEVVEAAKQANAHDFVSHFPEGYETNCGEKGAQMSGGQKQRIAIARALVRKPKVLLLDEATSALDADSEAVVQEALDRMMTDRTTLVIAHRLSTIQHADKIIVIAKGAVQEVGSHDELLSRNGVYATLVRRQLQRTQSTATMGLSRDVSSANLPVCTEE